MRARVQKIARLASVGPRTRLAGAVLLVLLAVPGTLVRTTVPAQRSRELTASAVPFAQTRGWPRVAGIWDLRSPDLQFGGYSALLLQGGSRARAFSDLGEQLAFTLPEVGGISATGDARLSLVPPDPAQARVRQDIESVTGNPATGQYWVGYEQVHAIRRFGPDGRAQGFVRPAQMRDWPNNSGTEALVRLADGRFLALGERNGIGLLFAKDPTAEPGKHPIALRFAVTWPAGYHPSDAVQLPDGRVLVLMRKVVRAWPMFSSLLMIGDVRDIAADRTWRPRPAVRLDALVPRENYEGLALTRTEGAITLWIISDDNFSTFQRTLLVKLDWAP